MRELGKGVARAAGRAASLPLGQHLTAFELWAGWFYLAVVAVALAYGCSVGADRPKVVTDCAVLGSVLLAATLAGGIAGFVFAIPRLLTRDDLGDDAPRSTGEAEGEGAPRRRRPARRPLAGNSNLEEVSDWLTKILVGLGLVNARPAIRLVGDLATYVSTKGLDDAPGSAVVVVSLGLTGLLWGFLFFYLQTRTRITLLLFAAEEAQTEGILPGDSVAAGNEGPVTRDLERLDVSGALSTRIGHAASKADPTPGDEKLLAFGFDDLSTPQEFAAWGSAQARAGNLEAAETALRRANVLAAGDPTVLRRLAEVRALKGDLRGAVENLAEAAHKQPGTWRIKRRELFYSLYLPPRDGFARAIPIADALAEHPEGGKDPMVHLWRACASRSAPSLASARGAGQDDLRADREAALAAVRKVVALRTDPKDSVRVLLAKLLAPKPDRGVDHDDDLADFAADQEFVDAIGAR